MAVDDFMENSRIEAARLIPGAGLDVCNMLKVFVNSEYKHSLGFSGAWHVICVYLA
jgi:hypothetical protein